MSREGDGKGGRRMVEEEGDHILRWSVDEEEERGSEEQTV